MNTKEFLKVLRECEHLFEWKVRKNKEIIGRKIISPLEQFETDPITAVYYYLTGKQCKVWKSRRLRKELGLTEELRTTIIRACCDVLISKEDRSMRANLMAILINKTLTPEEEKEAQTLYQELIDDLKNASEWGINDNKEML